jgi:hypothetical protein
MRALTRSTALLLLVAAAAAPRLQAAPDPKDVVYITASGDSYHRKDCRHLKTSKLKTTREDAEKAGKNPCKICKP